MINMALNLVLAVLLLLPLTFGYNYCNNRTHLCDLRKLKHFMCRLEEFPAFGTAKFHAIVPDTGVVRRETLGVINTFRNTFASGDLTTRDNKSFPAAKRMRRLNWDEELAYLARTHSATVSFKHSECRCTLRFPWVGEVMSLLAPQESKPTILHVLKKLLTPMFEEYKDVEDPEGLLVAYDPIRDFPVSHFTLFASDRVSRVGCGIAVGTDCNVGRKVGFCHFLTCHFDFNNVANSYVYKAGKPASGCNDWNTVGSHKYSHLCANPGGLLPTVDD
ncbi:antigen 5 like allergen Cul n 1-like isoform X2 [Drosophila biarmipes]|uniref:antigen 5 like allergen Cul n 1-like isoform X2 n=1 Tax=Drosophila biarmipes TaxID=125945 RepID=UPI0007E80E8F|nr:antigen 5 like allergen Cul n 1-like isoform X2 [Drosophila biarmipes]